jgi:hypothetical protein
MAIFINGIEYNETNTYAKIMEFTNTGIMPNSMNYDPMAQTNALLQASLGSYSSVDYTGWEELDTLNLPVHPDIPSDELVKGMTYEAVMENNTTQKKDNTVKQSLLGRLKDNSDTLNNKLEIQNELLVAQITLQADSNATNAELVNQLKKQNKILDSMYKAKLASNEIAKESFKSNNNANNFHNSKNALVMEKVDKELNGIEGLYDSNGDKVIPFNAKSLKDAEKSIETKDMNETTISELEEDGVFDDFHMGLNLPLSVLSSFGMLPKSAQDAVEKTYEEFLTDGFDFDANPFNMINDYLKEDLENMYEKIKEESEKVS